jgi:alkylhydroperoxidase family enzyme
MPALDSVEWESCLLEPLSDPVAERAVRKALGIVPDGYRYLFDSGWWPEAMIAFSTNTLPLLHVAPDLADAVALVVSQDNACRYCLNITRGMLGILGYSEARIRRLEDDLLAADFEPADRAALQCARRIARSAPMVTADDAAPLLTLGWSDAAVKELAAVVAVNIFFNRSSTLPALPYDAAAKVFGRTWMR